MNADVLDQQIELAQQRLRALSQQAGRSPEEKGVLDEALEQLSIALYELRVTSEELRHHADELASSRQALEAERQRYQELFDFAPDGYLVTDAVGIIVEANRAAATMLGVRQDFLVGKPLAGFLAVDERAEFRRLLDRLQHHDDIGRVELLLEPRDAPIFPAACTVAPAQDPAGRLAGLRWSIQDLTKLKHAEEQVLQSARLAAIGEAMVGLTHESRNALQRAQASLELLVRRVQDRPEALDFVERIQNSQDHLHQLFEEVRDYAAPIHLDVEPSDLGEILQATWTHLMTLDPSRVAQLTQETGGLDLCCEVDAQRMRQVFRHIVENSLSACSDPVAVRARWSDGQIARQRALQVALNDNGPGLGREGRERIFAPFYTTKTHGTGLGMAITKRIVEAHGGHIAVGDAESGTEIVIIVPRSSERP